MLLHTSVLFLGFSPVFGKLITLNEGLLTWYRVFFSAVILFFVLKLFKIDSRMDFREKFNIAKIGLLLTLSWVFFYAGIKYSNISIGVVCYCVVSFFTAILEPLISKTKFKLSEFLLSILTMIGISLIFHFDSTYQFGIVLGVISPVFYALYSIYNKRLAIRYDSKLVSYYQMIGGTISLGILLPVYLHFFPATSLIPDGKNILYLLLLSLFCTVMVYIFLTEAMRKISAFTANLSMNMEPVYAIIIAFLFFDESKEVNFSFYIGLFFVVLSVVLQMFISVRKAQ